MGHEHRLVAGSAWLAGSVTAGLPWWQVAAGLPCAVAAANVPDVDNTRWFRKLDRALPDEELGGCGPLAHRGLLHWWGLPGLAGALLVAGRPPVPDRLFVALLVCAWAALVGWLSHILGDLAFGQAGRGTPRGVPLAPWGWHIGLGLDADGALAWLAARLAPVAAAAWCVVLTMGMVKR